MTISQPNNRLFVGSIPKTKTKDEIFDEFHKHTSGLTEVILYYQVDEKTKNGSQTTTQQQNGVGQTSSSSSAVAGNSAQGQKNRGFCFLEYDTHQAASQARRRLLSGFSTNQRAGFLIFSKRTRKSMEQSDRNGGLGGSDQFTGVGNHGQGQGLVR